MSPHQNMATVPDAPHSVQQSYGNAICYNDKLLAYMAFRFEKVRCQSNRIKSVYSRGKLHEF
jgi:hypothetical protein